MCLAGVCGSLGLPSPRCPESAGWTFSFCGPSECNSSNPPLSSPPTTGPRQTPLSRGRSEVEETPTQPAQPIFFRLA